MGWPKVKLEEVLEQDLDFVNDLEPIIYKKLSVKLYGKGVVPDKPVDARVVRMNKHQIAKEGQVIVSEIWAKKGAIGIVPTDGGGALCTSHFFLFNRNPRRVTESWLRYLFVGNFLEPQLSAEARGTTGYASVRPRHFLQCEVPLPPLAQQHRIVAKLDKVAGLVAERGRVLETAEHDAQAMLSNAFREVIDGAPYRPMAEVAPLVRRPVAVEPDRSYPELGVRSFGRGTFHKPALAGIAVGSKKLFRIRQGDLLFNIVFAWEGAVAIAQTRDDGRVGSHRFLTCVPDETRTTADFLRFYFLTSEGLQKLGEASPGGAGRNRTLGLKKLDAITVPVPPLYRQHWFDRLQRQVHQMEAIRKSAGQDVDSLLPALLQRVFNDESPSFSDSVHSIRR